MLCFDKLMIKTSINNISDIGDDFVANIKNDVIISHRYKQRNAPFENSFRAWA